MFGTVISKWDTLREPKSLLPPCFRKWLSDLVSCLCLEEVWYTFSNGHAKFSKLRGPIIGYIKGRMQCNIVDGPGHLDSSSTLVVFVCFFFFKLKNYSKEYKFRWFMLNCTFTDFLAIVHEIENLQRIKVQCLLASPPCREVTAGFPAAPVGSEKFVRCLVLSGSPQ